MLLLLCRRGLIEHKSIWRVYIDDRNNKIMSRRIALITVILIILGENLLQVDQQQTVWAHWMFTIRSSTPIALFHTICPCETKQRCGYSVEDAKAFPSVTHPQPVGGLIVHLGDDNVDG